MVKIQSIYNTKDENLPSSSSEKLKELEEEIGGKITGLENSNASFSEKETLELEDLKKELEGIKTFIQDTNKISLTFYS